MAEPRSTSDRDISLTPSARPPFFKRSPVGSKPTAAIACLLICTAIIAALSSWRSNALSERWLGVSSYAEPSHTSTTGFSKPPLSVDLNHDNRLDSLALVPDGHGGETIQVTLVGIGNRELKSSGPRVGSRGVLYAADVDHDANLDLVRESENGLDPPLVWLGDGKGNFVLSAALRPIAIDFFSFPPAPNRPYSSSGSRGTSWVGSTAEKRHRSPLGKPASNSWKIATSSRKPSYQPDEFVRIWREVLLWLSRMIKAPPALPVAA